MHTFSKLRKGFTTGTSLAIYIQQKAILRYTLSLIWIQEDSFHSRPTIKLAIPDQLKALLVDDWENVTKNQQLVPLPHPSPLSKILNGLHTGV